MDRARPTGSARARSGPRNAVQCLDIERVERYRKSTCSNKQDDGCAKQATVAAVDCACWLLAGWLAGWLQQRRRHGGRSLARVVVALRRMRTTSRASQTVTRLTSLATRNDGGCDQRTATTVLVARRDGLAAWPGPSDHGGCCSYRSHPPHCWIQ